MRHPLAPASRLSCAQSTTRDISSLHTAACHRTSMIRSRWSISLSATIRHATCRRPQSKGAEGCLSAAQLPRYFCRTSHSTTASFPPASSHLPRPHCQQLRLSASRSFSTPLTSAAESPPSAASSHVSPALHPPISAASPRPPHDFPLDAAPPSPSSPPSTLSSLLSLLPAAVQPYIALSRLDKPIGTWLLLLPCYWSLALATLPSQLPSPSLVAAFACGAFIMRGAGCTVNDMWDRAYDAQVSRTRLRPLASGQLTFTQASVWLMLQLSLGLCCVLCLNLHTIALAFLAVPVAAVYPLMKRVTHWPQLVLGVAFNSGAVLGYSAATASVLPAVCLPLYAAGILWTLHYDTIYAHQDAADDATLGLRSTALLFASQTHRVLAVFALLMIVMLAAAGYSNGMTRFYYCSLAAIAAHLGWQLHRLDIGDRQRCWRLFTSNRWIGGILLAGIVLDIYCRPRDEEREKERTAATARSRETVWGLSGYELLAREWRRWRTRNQQRNITREVQ